MKVNKILKKLSWERSQRVTSERFCGVRIRHSYSALYVMENVLNAIAPTKIVEFGSWRGGLTIFLSAWARNNRASLISIDNLDLMSKSTLNFIESSKATRFLKRDVFSDTCFKEVKGFVSKDRCLIYCDDGDKEKELVKYCELLSPGSAIGCHDYTIEVLKERIPRLFQSDFVPMLTDKQIENLGNIQQFWMKK